MKRAAGRRGTFWGEGVGLQFLWGRGGWESGVYPLWMDRRWGGIRLHSWAGDVF